MNPLLSIATRYLALIAFAIPFTGILSPIAAGAADHREAPILIGSGRLNAADINDIYVFRPPVEPDNVVFIMTVNPNVGLDDRMPFNPAVTYSLNVDTDDDAIADLAIHWNFESPRNCAEQTYTVSIDRFASNKAPREIAKGRVGRASHARRGARAYVGIQDDPFFFDSAAFSGKYEFCSAPAGPRGSSGTDGFAGSNVAAMVLEIPVARIGSREFSVWATTSVGDLQIDRLGKPLVATVFIPFPDRDLYNANEPADDLRLFGAIFGDLADVLLPDTLAIDTTRPTAFPNGRGLGDDVGDSMLSLAERSSVTDCVDRNDVPLPSRFPYLAPAH